MTRYQKIIVFTYLICLYQLASAQFTVDGQVVQRMELRNGYGKLISTDEQPAFFIGQRARLQANYQLKKVTLFVSAQDVRIWGNVPQLNISDGLFSAHEAWAKVDLDSLWSLKIGRQELNYDNYRFLSNADWTLQGRAHDFALLQYEKGKSKLHIGAGYNQNGQKLSGNVFTVSNQYKTAQMVHYENVVGNLHFSTLFWNNGKQYIGTDSIEHIYYGIRFMQTIGIPNFTYYFGNLSLGGFYYHQLGKDANDKKVNAFDANVQLSYLFDINKEKASKMRLTLGTEVLSGTSPQQTNGENNSFSPLYGANHLHNGYMDLFFVNGRHENNVGLIDAYARLRYDFNRHGFLALHVHSFQSAADIYDDTGTVSNELGTEANLTFGYQFNDNFALQAAYSQFFATTSLQALQNITTSSDVQNWAYFMLIYRPKTQNKFIGLIN